jgi:hypothetical protein
MPDAAGHEGRGADRPIAGRMTRVLERRAAFAGPVALGGHRQAWSRPACPSLRGRAGRFRAGGSSRGGGLAARPGRGRGLRFRVPASASGGSRPRPRRDRQRFAVRQGRHDLVGRSRYPRRPRRPGPGRPVRARRRAGVRPWRGPRRRLPLPWHPDRTGWGGAARGGRRGWPSPSGGAWPPAGPGRTGWARSRARRRGQGPSPMLMAGDSTPAGG